MNFYLKKRYIESSVKNNIHDSKKLWKTLKKVIPSKKKSIATNIVKSNDHGNVTTGKDTANSFNQFFTSVGKDLSKQFHNVNLKCPCNDVRGSTYQ